MQCFFLCRTFDDPNERDEVGQYEKMIVFASDEGNARQLAAGHAGLEDASVWLDQNLVECKPLNECNFGGPAVVLRGYSLATESFVRQLVQPTLMERLRQRTLASSSGSASQAKSEERRRT